MARARARQLRCTRARKGGAPSWREPGTSETAGPAASPGACWCRVGPRAAQGARARHAPAFFAAARAAAAASSLVGAAGDGLVRNTSIVMLANNEDRLFEEPCSQRCGAACA